MSNPLAGMLYDLAKDLIDKIFTSSKEQAKAVEEIIRKGKENGAKRLEIKLKNKTFFDIDVPGCDIKFQTTLGRHEETTMIVEYK